MEEKVILLYGNQLPPYKHIEKVAVKYWRYYERDKENGNYEENQFYDVWVSFQFTDTVPKEFSYITLSVPIKREFLSKFYSIFKALKGNVQLCEIYHSHPTAEISGITFEGYCYICSNETMILFLDSYRDENGNEDGIHTLDWYQNIPESKRWYIAKKDEDTEKVFEKWVVNLVSSYAKY